jgi:hypothetical protein
MRTNEERAAHFEALRAAAPRAMRGASSIFARWGCECGPGWIPIIIEALQRIHELLTEEEAERFHIRQIKQKWGELRIYWHLDAAEGEEEPQALTRARETVVGVNLSPDWQDARRAAIQAIVEEARAKADVSCETCGKPGTLHPVGHVQVLCPQHLRPVQVRDARALKEREAMLKRMAENRKAMGYSSDEDGSGR